MGNIDAKRDWGHARDFVEMQWMMLQCDQPEDFVIATGQQYSVRQFIIWSAQALGIELEFKDRGVNEVGVVARVTGEAEEFVSVGQEILRIDPKYFRPAEVETLPATRQNKEKLGLEQEFRCRKCAARWCRRVAVRKAAENAGASLCVPVHPNKHPRGSI